MRLAIATPLSVTSVFLTPGASLIPPVTAPAGALRRATAMVVLGVLVAALIPVVAEVSSPSPPAALPETAPSLRPPASPASALAGVAPRFEANQGQLDPAVRFFTRSSGFSLFLTPTEAVMVVARPQTTASGASDVVRMRLVGARPDPKMTGSEVLAGDTNYLTGNDPEKWVTGVSSYAKVMYHDIYQGVDLLYRSDDKGRLEYDFVVAPGADPDSIAMDFSGGEGLRLDRTGALVIATASGDLRQHKPRLYQDIGGERREVPGRFVLNGNRVSFDVGSYDLTHALVIDPVLAFSTYLGGGGNDEGNGIAVDSEGFSYVVGTTLSIAFPTTEGADRTCGSGENCQPLEDGAQNLPTVNNAEGVATFGPRSTPRPDAFVTKFAPDGQVVYSTYLGGKGADEGLAITVDSAGRPYIAGKTKSDDFPTTANAFDRTCGTDGLCNFRLTENPFDNPAHGQTKADAFVTKLDDTGGLDLVERAYSTFFGGSSEETRAGYMLFYPSTAQREEPGDEKEFDSGMPNGQIGTLSGGGSPESFLSNYRGASAGIAVVGETVYLTSTTVSTDLIRAPNPLDPVAPAAPGYTPPNPAYDVDCGTGGLGNCNKRSLNGAVQLHTDLFVAQIETTRPANESQKALRYVTYLGGSKDDVVGGIAATRALGQTRLYVARGPGACATCAPACNPHPGIFGYGHLAAPTLCRTDPPAQDVHLPDIHAFVFADSGAGSLLWSTDIGSVGSVNDVMGVAVDVAGSPYVTGKSRGGLLLPESAAQSTHGGNDDAFVAKFSAHTAAQEYATYLGGSSNDVGRAIAVDSAGQAFVTGETSSYDDERTTPKVEGFPTKNALQPMRSCDPCSTEVDAFVAVIDPAGSGDDRLVYSTYLGGNSAVANGSSEDVGRAIAIRDGTAAGTSVYVSGITASNDFPTLNAHSDLNTGGTEAFVARLSPGGPLPQVSGLEPNRGNTSGGETILIRGTHLSDVTTIRFGEEILRCPSASCDLDSGGTTVTVVTPPLFDESGDTSVEVVLSVPGTGTSVPHGRALFTYWEGSLETTEAPIHMPAPDEDIVIGKSGGTVPPIVLDREHSCGAPWCGNVFVLTKENTVDLYDPATGQWSSKTCNGTTPELTAPNARCPNAMTYPRKGHTATLITSDGTILVAGGSAPTAELYNPATGTWKQVGRTNINRTDHTATLLSNAAQPLGSTAGNCGQNCGKVLLVGGRGSTGGQQSRGAPAAGLTAELYNPAIGASCSTTEATDCDRAWSMAGTLRGERFGGHTATLLVGPACGSNCGKVLVVGGDYASESLVWRPQRMIEIYDPLSGAFDAVHSAEAGAPRVDHTATILEGPGCESDCGKVLLVGGYKDSYPSARQQEIVELYDPAVSDPAQALSRVAPLKRARTSHSAVALPGGRVLLTGGLWGTHDMFSLSDDQTIDVYHPRPRAWRPSSPAIAAGAGVLMKGLCGTRCDKVLIVGQTNQPTARPSAELYTPAPFADSMKPFSGPATGGTKTLIGGRGFSAGAMDVYFARSEVCRSAGAACEVGSSTIDTRSPPVSDQAQAEVWVARKGVGISRVPQTFDYIGPPGPVAPFRALPRSDKEIDLSFGAAGSVGTGNPPVKDYIVKHSREPITTSNFDSTPSLCEGGTCHFEPAEVGETLSVEVTLLRSRTRYFYAVRAVRHPDQLGPIAFADATTSGAIPIVEDPVVEGPPPDDSGTSEIVGKVVNQVRYERGYSLVGLPAGSVVSSQSPLYGWFDQGARDARGQSSTYSIQAADVPVQGGHGHWAWFSNPQTVELSEAGVSAMDLPLGRYRASMVGNPSGTGTSTISGHDFTARWDPSLNGGAGGYHISDYQQTQELAIGEGIWAFSYRDTNLRLRAR